MLINAGVNPNIRDKQGYTALWWCNDVAMYKALLDHGADVNSTSNEGFTPLMTAANDTIALMLTVNQEQASIR